MNLEELRDLLDELNTLKDEILTEMNKWWWLDYGKIPLVSIRKFIKKGKNVEIFLTPKEPLDKAILDIIENINILLELPASKVRESHLNKIKEDLNNIITVINNIKDADNLITRFEMLTKMGNISIEHKGDKVKLEKLANEAIKMLIERFKQNPLRWEDSRKFFENIANNLEKKISI